MYIHIYIHRACKSSLSSIDLVFCRNIRKETHKNPKRDPQISKKRYMYIHIYIHRACKSSLSSMDLICCRNIRKETQKYPKRDPQTSEKRHTNIHEATHQFARSQQAQCCKRVEFYSRHDACK